MESSQTPDHTFFMHEALSLARQAESLHEVPVGAVIVYRDEIIGRGYNCPIGQNDPTAHAEIQAIRQAAHHLGNYRLTGCDLYVTVEPCAMCAGAIVHSRISGLYYGATEPRAGAITSRVKLLSSDFLNHRVEICGGILEEQCANVMRLFFQERRSRNNHENALKS